MQCDCRSVFNRLSGADRLKLKSAAFMTAVTGFIRDDTAVRPWRYPFYAAYLAVVVTPLPFMGASTALLAATGVWARYSRMPMAQRLQKTLRDSFDGAALVRAYRDFIRPDPEAPHRLTVRNSALGWHATKKSCHDTWLTTKHACKALKRLIIS